MPFIVVAGYPSLENSVVAASRMAVRVRSASACRSGEE
jgi:hypothetical protein